MAYQSMTLCASHSPGFARDADEQFGDVFRQGLGRAKALVEEFAPTLVVFFGSDHRRSFTETIPSISVVLEAEGLGDLLSPTGAYDVPTALAQELAHHLLDADFDVAFTRQVALDHGFGQTAADLLGAIDAVPLIPVFINCATAPLAGPARAAALGAEVGAFCRELDERVLFLGSGGLSHNPPTLALIPDIVSEEERRAVSAAHREAAKKMIRPAWDEAFLANLGSADPAWAYGLTQDDLDPAGAGANEVRTWLAAYTAGGAPMSTVAYEPVPEWITGMGIAVSSAGAHA